MNRLHAEADDVYGEPLKAAVHGANHSVAEELSAGNDI
jgi:hypothetical protein